MSTSANDNVVLIPRNNGGDSRLPSAHLFHRFAVNGDASVGTSTGGFVLPGFQGFVWVTHMAARDSRAALTANINVSFSVEDLRVPIIHQQGAQMLVSAIAGGFVAAAPQMFPLIQVGPAVSPFASIVSENPGATFILQCSIYAFVYPPDALLFPGGPRLPYYV